jgi:hypothetical protein
MNKYLILFGTPDMTFFPLLRNPVRFNDSFKDEIKQSLKGPRER